jgi:hypothetical protein
MPSDEEDIKMIGVYASRKDAEAAVERPLDRGVRDRMTLMSQSTQLSQRGPNTSLEWTRER